MKRNWGHCTVDYAVHVAAVVGARRLALFHHDPARNDDAVDALLADAHRPGADARPRRGARRVRGPHDVIE